MWYRFSNDTWVKKNLQSASPDPTVYNLIGQQFVNALILRGMVPRWIAPYVAVATLLESIWKSAPGNADVIPAHDHEVYMKYLRVIFADNSDLAEYACKYLKEYLQDGNDEILKIGQDPTDYNAAYMIEVITAAPYHVLKITKPRQEFDNLDLPTIVK